MVENWENIEDLTEEVLIKNNECSVNRVGLYISGVKQTLYRCVKCIDQKDLIVCESCINRCHTGHKYFEDDSVVNNVICDCAKYSHNVRAKKKSIQLKAGNILFKGISRDLSKTIDKVVVKCSFVEIIKQSKSGFLFEKKGKYVCPFCVVNCLEKECGKCISGCENLSHFLESFNKVPISQIKFENKPSDVNCDCYNFTEKECHQALQNLDNLKRFFSLKEESCLTSNVNRLIYTFISNEGCYKFWETIHTQNFKILTAIQNNDYIRFQIEESVQYLKTMKLMNQLGKRLKKNYLEIRNQNFKLDILFEFLNEIFTTTEIKNDVFCLYKFYNLKILRRFFILPRLKNLFFVTIQTDFNTNSFHRLLLIPL